MENLDSTTKDVFEPESLEMPAEAIKESFEQEELKKVMKKLQSFQKKAISF